MAEIPATEQTTEEIQQQTESRESLQTNVLDKIKSSDVFKAIDKEFEPRKQEEITEPKRKEEQNTEEQSQGENEEESQEESQEDEEEVVAKSKVQPRIDRLTKQLLAQQAEIEKLKNQSADPRDATQRKIQDELDTMSTRDLENALDRVEDAILENKDDPNKRAEHRQLKRQIERTIAEAPQKFVNNQVQEANKTIERMVADGEVTDANYPKVLEIAKEIYAKYPKMQKAVDGQAMAIELAVEHYKALGKVTSVKADTQNLKGQLNNLKKKTALDTKGVKGGGDKVNLDKLRSNAMNGSMRDKERFAHSDSRFKIDAMIPDFLKG